MFHYIRNKLTQAQIIAMGYFLVITVGTLLLMLLRLQEAVRCYAPYRFVYGNKRHLRDRPCCGGYRFLLECVRTVYHPAHDSGGRTGLYDHWRAFRHVPE